MTLESILVRFFGLIVPLAIGLSINI